MVFDAVSNFQITLLNFTSPELECPSGIVIEIIETRPSGIAIIRNCDDDSYANPLTGGVI